MPILFGAAGIVLGFIARREEQGLGAWAIGIGAYRLSSASSSCRFFNNTLHRSKKETR